MNAVYAFDILSRISDTCQESVPLLEREGADFVFYNYTSTMIRIVYLIIRLFAVAARGWRTWTNISTIDGTDC